MKPKPTHDTPHPLVSGGFYSHASAIRTSDGWVCSYCRCPHEWSDESFHAAEARRCPDSFEDRCESCGQVYECAPDCAGIAAIFADPDVYVAGSAGRQAGEA